MALSTLLALTLQVTAKTAIDSHSAGPSIQEILASGVAIDQCDIAYAKQRTVADNATPDTIDLASGGLVGVDNNVVSFVKVVAILIVSNATDDTHILTVGGGTNSPAWFPAQLLGGKRAMLLKYDRSLAGYPVTAGTGDIIKVVTAAGTLVPYTIVVIGRSA